MSHFSFQVGRQHKHIQHSAPVAWTSLPERGKHKVLAQKETNSQQAMRIALAMSKE